jgi:hypothetical protein
MTIQSRKRLIFHWTTPKNLLAILLFIILIIIAEFIIIAFVIPTAVKDSTAITVPFLNVTISLLYHIVPGAVIIALTASFTHLATHTATIPQKAQMPKKPQPPKYTRLKALRRFHKKLRIAARKIRTRIMKTPTIAYIRQRIALAKTFVKSAAIITLTFILTIALVTIAAYPKLVPTTTADFLQWNTVFLNFVTATIKASETIANTVPPIGVVATAIHNALIVAAPTFRNVLESAASAITSGLVSLSPIEKYLIIQNAAAWIIAVTTLGYSQYIKTRHYRR